jgi:hypothetical protein
MEGDVTTAATTQPLESAETTENVPVPANETPTPPAKVSGKTGGSLANLRPWKPGTSGNPSGRPRVEPKVRKMARRYDAEMLEVLVQIARDPKAPVSERRRAALTVIEIGSGRAEFKQSVGNPNGAPLVNLNFGAGQPGPLSPEAAYRMMVEGSIEPDSRHDAFKPVVEVSE